MKMDRHMDFEVAKRFALDSFFLLHPKESLPDWVNHCVTTGGFQNLNGSWTIELAVNLKIQLRENEAWEMRNGRRVLTFTDPKTGQKKIFIHYSHSDPLVVFRALVNTATNNVHVELDSDFSKMDENLYERIGE